MIPYDSLKVFLVFDVILVFSALFYLLGEWNKGQRYYKQPARIPVLTNSPHGHSLRTGSQVLAQVFQTGASNDGNATILGTRSFVEALRPQLEAVDHGNITGGSKMISSNRSKEVIRLKAGFFEGFRFSWVYPLLFKQPHPSTQINCQCILDEDQSVEVAVNFEKLANRTNRFDILFFPHDVGVLPGRSVVWETILTTAPANQTRVYATYEGAFKLRNLASSRHSRKAFHWSWTHHSKSEFTMPYGSYIEFNESMSADRSRSVATKNWAAGKTGLVAWMSTWTITDWHRVDFVKFLQEHFPIDLFGKQFQQCPRFGRACEEKLKKYKFYLALENSCCEEYITEKFWRTLTWDMIPIVLGANRSEYERVAPPNSFIHIDDFDSVQKLADYVIFLNKNDDEYDKYFLWKSRGTVIIYYPPFLKNPKREPPSNSFYSCTSVCRVAKKYIEERDGDRTSGNVTRSPEVTYFDPRAKWWCGSCVQCGQHNWIRRFSKPPDKKRGKHN